MPIIGSLAAGSARGLGGLRTFGASAVDDGAMFPLSLITVGGAGASFIEFTNIPTTYAHLQLRAISRSASSFHHSYIRVGNGSVDTGSNYSSHILVGSGASAASENYTSATATYLESMPAQNGASIFSAMTIDFLDYANTNKHKTIRTMSGGDTNGSGYLFFLSGRWGSTSAINTIRFINNNSTNIQEHSTFALYGIKGAA